MTGRLDRQARYFYLILIAVFLAMMAYTIPWLVTPAVSLSLGANDLAEWASLHPEVRASSPSLLVSLLLRLPLVFLALIVGFSTPGPARKSMVWWLGVLVIMFIVLLLLPPLEFFTSARGDQNYQQQMTLAIIALGGSVFGCSGLIARLRVFVVAGCALAGVGVSGIGFQKAHALMRGFNLSVQIGGGVGLTMLFFVAIMVVAWQLNIKQGSAR